MIPRWCLPAILVVDVVNLGPIVKSSSSQLRAYYRGRQQVVRDPGICAGVPVCLLAGMGSVKLIGTLVPRHGRGPVSGLVEQDHRGEGGCCPMFSWLLCTSIWRTLLLV